MYFAKKFLHELSPGLVVESAAFVHNETLHYCVPSQTGCNIGCIMCATTYDNHSSGKGITFEDYQLILNRLEVESNHINLDKVLSFSGHGEPGLNQHVISQFIASNIKKFSEIHLTTILPKNSIDFFLNLKLVAIYISLHEVSDQARSQIIPKGNISNITDIINFAEMFSKNNGKVTFNYLLLDTNTTKNHAKALMGANKQKALKFHGI